MIFFRFDEKRRRYDLQTLPEELNEQEDKRFTKRTKRCKKQKEEKNFKFKRCNKETNYSDSIKTKGTF